LAIARLVSNKTPLIEDNLAPTPFLKARIEGRTQINGLTQVIMFKFIEHNEGSNKPKNHYSDLQMIGKHYLINETSKHLVRRHYTIANCMRKEVYEKYI
jgi:hypothetical protein